MAVFRRNFVTHRAYYGLTWNDVRTTCGYEWHAPNRFMRDEDDNFVTCLACIVAPDPYKGEPWGPLRRR